MNIIAVILYYILIISICGKSINININRFASIQQRLRNTSLRVLVFNEIYKSIREKSLELLNNYNVLIISKSSLFTSCFYDLTYKYYSMDEADRDNLELIINLLC